MALHKIPESALDAIADDTFTVRSNIGYIWYYCRESFLRYSDKKSFYYCTKNKKQSENIINFIEKFQNKAKIVDRVVVIKTNHDSILLVKVSKFWSAKVRFSLLLALIRNGRQYNGKNFDSRLKAQYFTSNKSREALATFMRGRFYYKITGIYNTGWVNYCQKMNKAAYAYFSKNQGLGFV